MNKVNATYRYLDDHYIRPSNTFINTFTIFQAFSGDFLGWSKNIIISAFPVHFRVYTYIHNLPCYFRKCYNCEMPRTARLFKARIRIRCEFEESVWSAASLHWKPKNAEWWRGIHFLSFFVRFSPFFSAKSRVRRSRVLKRLSLLLLAAIKFF